MLSDQVGMVRFMESEPATRIVVRPYGSPLPLGMFSFGIGMLLLAGVGLGWIHGDDLRLAGLLQAGFVTPLELAAALFALLARDTGVATALGLFATSWLALGLAQLVMPPGATSPAMGLFLLGFAVMLLPLAATATLAKPLLAVTLLVSSARAAVSGVAELFSVSALQAVSGVLASVLFLLALFAGTVFLIEDVRQRPLLSFSRRGAGEAALRDGVGSQLRRASHEAGVRQQL